MIWKKTMLLFLVFLIFLFFFAAISLNLVSAEENITDEQVAENCLSNSRAILKEMGEEGFSTLRINDTLKTAESIYLGQLTLKEKKKSTDFSQVLVRCKEIEDIRENAFIVRDEFFAVKKFYLESFESGIVNTSSIDLMIADIEKEIKNERYEIVLPMIENTYQEITEVYSKQTILNIFYEATANRLKKFIEKNWIFLVSFLTILIILFLVYRGAIYKQIIKNKIKQLELRKKALRELMQQTQKDYFQYGKIPEGTFNIRTKKLAELVRDIDRQIPLLQEEIAKIERKIARNQKQAEKKEKQNDELKTGLGFEKKSSTRSKKHGKKIKHGKK